MTKHMDIHCQTRIFNSINYDTKYKICVFTPKNIKKIIQLFIYLMEIAPTITFLIFFLLLMHYPIHQC